VISRSGGTLVEVGSTNRTRIADYEAAITDDTRLILKVHPSNFRMVGFTEETSREELVALGKQRGIPVVEDVGSGALVDLTRYGLPNEPSVQEVLNSGVDVVTFSGDKLLGGPQAGILVGKRGPIEKMKKNPLMRALRMGKLSLAALEGTLRLYLHEDRLAERLPLLRMLTTDQNALLDRAQAFRDSAASLDRVTAEVLDGEGFSGGGSLPGQAMPTKVVAVAVQGLSPNALLDAFRASDPPVIARIFEDRVHVDLRTVRDSEVLEVLAALQRIVS
jgi:L-seryl-tRNA(Ser) seleniumtransferase